MTSISGSRLFLLLVIPFLINSFSFKSTLIRKTRRPFVYYLSNNDLSPVQLQSSNTETAISLDIETTQVQLSPQISAEMMTCRAPKSKNSSPGINASSKIAQLPPLVFIHGSFHASWCWAEKYLPYFANLGYDTYALSLRGTGGTFAGEGIKKIKIDDHVNDLDAFLKFVSTDQERQESSNENGVNIPSSLSPPPVLIAHSFGGMVVMKYLEKLFDDGKNNNQKTTPTLLSGTALLCSIPPSGNGKMTGRFLRRSLVDSWKITAGLAMRKCMTNEDLCRELFFGGGATEMDGISEEDMQRFQGYFKRDTDATTDLFDLAKKLPSDKIDDDGLAPFQNQLPPALVLGASDDFIVDTEGVRETAQYFGTDPTFVDSPHDVMLGRRWENGARAIQNW
eukprot:CAMPEP_0194355370 /NCGR_PEP_ID=MMETSP0174-20130528/3291_1 /TAXON_ID=216777 /ORGANISM="Proboscia alata, Strain PI-D3" /LENGTH=393 /DNA_ID=CAMNT_0039124619 /DNA_START=45 /DNA_END=1223 /DNA_ORIENTATION=+